MLDMSWGELMLIGGVALIVIGPKELPKALRTLGQITGKLRRMAGEFRVQFDEAIREAELDEIKRDLDGIKRTADGFKPSFNPVDTIRNELKSVVEGREASKAADVRSSSLQSTATAALETRDGVDPRPAGSYDVPRPTEPNFPKSDDPAATGPTSTGDRIP